MASLSVWMLCICKLLSKISRCTFAASRRLLSKSECVYLLFGCKLRFRICTKTIIYVNLWESIITMVVRISGTYDVTLFLCLSTRSSMMMLPLLRLVEMMIIFALSATLAIKLSLAIFTPSQYRTPRSMFRMVRTNIFLLTFSRNSTTEILHHHHLCARNFK